VKQRLLDILACPKDNAWPLKLFIFETHKLENKNIPKADEKTGVVCSFYCCRKGVLLVEEKGGDRIPLKEKNGPLYEQDCQECFAEEISAGVIKCPECGQMYPIIDEIPIMLDPELRKEELEREFTEKWAEKIKEVFEGQ